MTINEKEYFKPNADQKEWLDTVVIPRARLLADGAPTLTIEQARAKTLELSAAISKAPKKKP